MSRVFPPRIQEENDKLVKMILDVTEAPDDKDDDFDVDKFIEENASDEYKKYMKALEQEYAEMRAQGIMS